MYFTRWREIHRYYMNNHPRAAISGSYLGKEGSVLISTKTAWIIIFFSLNATKEMLPFDILTHIAHHADRNTLLNLRIICNEVKGFVTPLAFRSLRVVCTEGSFTRLCDLGIISPTLSQLVLELIIDESEFSGHEGKHIMSGLSEYID